MLELGIGWELVDPTLWTHAMKSCMCHQGGLTAHLSWSPVLTPPAANFALVGQLQVSHFDLDQCHALQTSQQHHF